MTNWKDVELFWAGGGTRASRWDRAQGRAVATEDGDDLTSPEITDEHLRALAEIRGEGSCANWFTDRDLTGSGPQRDTIDWAGFPDTCTLCGELLCLADPDLDDAERGPLCSKCAEQASGTGNAQG